MLSDCEWESESIVSRENVKDCGEDSYRVSFSWYKGTTVVFIWEVKKSSDIIYAGLLVCLHEGKLLFMVNF